MSNGALWSSLLVIIGLAILVTEFFVPSGGLLTIAAVAALLSAIGIAFSESVAWGMGVTASLVVLVPITLALLIRIWPHTSMGRKILTRRPGESVDVLPDDETHRQRRMLLGSIGVAETDLLPAGTVVLLGQRVDALSIDGAIDAGHNVVVTSVEAGKIHVMKTQKAAEQVPAVDPEATSVRDLGLEELEDPLA